MTDPALSHLDAFARQLDRLAEDLERILGPSGPVIDRVRQELTPIRTELDELRERHAAPADPFIPPASAEE